jgi:hypothetical protein
MSYLIVHQIVQKETYIPKIPALRRLRQEDPKFEVSLGYKTSPCSQKTKEKILKKGSNSSW